MNNNYIIVYKTPDNEIGVVKVTGEDHIDAEATFNILLDEHGWAVEEIVSITQNMEHVDDVYEMEDDDQWLDKYVHINY